MLTEERYAFILDLLQKKRSVSLNDLCNLLDVSESTIRRDLNALDEQGLLIKVHGGALASLDSGIPATTFERNVEEKSHLFTQEKAIIARYAASLIDDGDLVFIDAGTTTEKMIDFLPQKNVTFVTNAFLHTKKLAQRGFRVFIPAGEIKLSTEAIVGAECLNSLRCYNFTKSFIGANGISLTHGISTPDRNEASVKTAVIRGSRQSFVLADHSKFDQISAVTFSSLGEVSIITDELPDDRYNEETIIKEVSKL